MKVSAVLALIAAVTVVSADTNAQRLARGLAPNAPGKRATPVAAARRNSPSGYPSGGQCNTGAPHCCDSVDSAGSGGPVDQVLKDLGLIVGVGTNVGLSCTGVLGDGSDCSQQPVCCEDNSFNGLINLGCSPINIL